VNRPEKANARYKRVDFRRHAVAKATTRRLSRRVSGPASREEGGGGFHSHSCCNDTCATPPDASRTPSSTRSLPELELQTGPHQTRRAGVAGDGPDRQSSGELPTRSQRTLAKGLECGSRGGGGGVGGGGKGGSGGSGAGSSEADKRWRGRRARDGGANANSATTPITRAVASCHQQLGKRQVISTRS
jgi:hypothetical protein